MDDQTYQFYSLNYEEFKNDHKIVSKLDYDSILKRVEDIKLYIQIFDNFVIDETLAKFKVFYACKRINQLRLCVKYFLLR